MATPLDMPTRRKAAPSVKVAYRTWTGKAASTIPLDEPYEPYCFTCGRCTDHLGEHDDLGDRVEYDYARGVVYDRERTPWHFEGR
jgi:hypothetical protein